MRRLLIRPGGIGDFILSLPAMQCLYEAETEVWVATQNLPLARFASRADSILSTGLDLVGIPGVEPPARLIERLREFDSIISWYGTNRREFRDAVVAIGLPFRFFTALPEKESTMHATDFYLNQAESVAGRCVPRLPRIDCARRDEGFAVIHPFSGSAAKNWPLDRYRELAGRLAERMPVYWCAGPSEELEGAVRMEDLYQLASWLARARIYIGNDSGITHLAAAAGAPVVALFGPTDPSVWAPRGDHVRIVATERPGEPMERIALQRVTEAVSKV